MKPFILFLAFIVFTMVAIAQSFENMVNSISSVPKEQRQQVLDDYFNSGVKVPVIEGNMNVFFVFKGAVDMVSVAGDATAWTPSLAMKKIEGTDYWFCKATYEPDARLEYKIVVNGKDWILDPLNQNIIEGGLGKNSELIMPEYNPPLYINERDIVPWGTYFDTVIYSKYFKEDRPLRIYLPPRYEKSNTRYPVVYFQDGFDFFRMTAVRDIMDNMTYEHKISPLIAVFVLPVHRDKEYSGKLMNSYTRFMLQELIPFIDNGYRTIAQPTGRAQIGISNGGNMALWLAAAYPELIGNVAALSSNVQEKIVKAYRENGCTNQKIFINIGKYDLSALIPLARSLKTVIEERKCNLSYHEYPEGHNWKFWQKYLPDALEYFFPVE